MEVGDVAGGGVGVEDVMQFQELDSEEERAIQQQQYQQQQLQGGGVRLDREYSQHGSSNNNNGKYFNPDELYFNDMDLRAWERRTGGEIDGLAYGEDYDYDYGYGYGEDDVYVDEGFYDDSQGPNLNISPEEYQELLFQRALDKIRAARATGKQDVSLTPEELQAYENKMLGRPAPAVRQPPVSQLRPTSSSSLPPVRGAPNISPSGTMSTATAMPAPATGSTSASGAASTSVSTRPKRSRRSSLFGLRSSKPSEKSSRKRTSSTSRSDPTANLRASLQAAFQPQPQPSQPPQPQPQFQSHPLNQGPLPPPPGFIVPGPNGQPIYNPINRLDPRIYHPRESQAQTFRRNSSPFRPQGSRSASLNSNSRFQMGTPPRATPPRDMPGGFPSGSPQAATPPRRSSRPVSSSSHYSVPDDYELPRNRSRSGSFQQRGAPIAEEVLGSRQQQQQAHPELISFPINTRAAEPYSYATVPTTAQGQPIRRVVSSGSQAESSYMAVPRRVPVPQRPSAGIPISQSHSDPVVPRAGTGSESPEEGGGVLVDVVPTVDGGYKVRSSGVEKEKGSSSSPGGGSERRRRSGRSSRKR